MKLDAIPEGSRVLIDTNILIYARRGISMQCRDLLNQCVSGNISGVLTTIGVAEYCHRRMMMEAQSKGLAGSNPSKSLSQAPNVVRQLTQYGQEVEDLLSGELALISIEAIDVIKGLELQRLHGLMTNDSLQLAAAMRFGITNFASADSQYTVVPNTVVFCPDDV